MTHFQISAAVVAKLHREIDLAWEMIENGWDIEPRAYFEKEAPTNGFGSALAQAVHHMWKREVKTHPKFPAFQAALVEVGSHDKAIRCICPPPDYANHSHEPDCPLAEVISQSRTEQPKDATGQGRLLLNAYGRACYDAGRASASHDPGDQP